MIKITAESKGDRTELELTINGNGEDVVDEAVHIMQQLPKRIKEADQLVFFRFLVKLTETDMFRIGMGPKNRGVAKAVADMMNEEADDGGN